MKIRKTDRVYISGPITGTSDYMERFETAEKELKKRGFLTVNPTSFSKHLTEADFNWEEFMDVSFVLLKQCTGIYMLPNWKKSKGAVAEYDYALHNRIKVIH